VNKILGCLAAAGMAWFARDASAQGEAVATLQVDKGVVMVSTGGDYVSAPSGLPLASGTRVMITDGAATVRYGNGCTRTLSTPGVYTVNAVCDPAAAGGWSTPGVVAAVVAGAVATGVVVHNITHDEHPRPISR
jgi:hypothetical protein